MNLEFSSPANDYKMETCNIVVVRQNQHLEIYELLTEFQLKSSVRGQAEIPKNRCLESQIGFRIVIVVY